MYSGLKFNIEGWHETFLEEVAKFGTDNASELRRGIRVGEFPAEIYREMGKRGWMGPLTPTEFGGLGGGVAEYCAILEETGRWVLVSPQGAVQAQTWLLKWGTPEQKAKYLGPIARGEMVFSESISEPGAGSSLKLMKATARRDGSDWILNGHKTHVNLGVECDVTLFYAMAPEGLTAFLVDRDAGYTAEHTDPIGLRLAPTADVFFDDVRVPADAVLAEVGRGMDTFLDTFNTSRLGNASEMIGWARRALSEAIEYAREREVGGNKVTDFQGIQWTVADCYADLYAASLARNEASNIIDRGGSPALATSLAKKLAIDAAERTVNEVFALTGGHGLYTTTDFGQLLHDVKVLRVAGGSKEVLRNYVARKVLNPDFTEL
jgi:alkylation response protein AidB-like acyl-CoA dehydrogenase